MVTQRCKKCNHIWDYTGNQKHPNGKQKTSVTCGKCHNSTPMEFGDTTNPQKWTEFDINDLKEMIKKGMDSKTISTIIGIDEDDIKQKIIELKLQPKTTNNIPPPKTITHKIGGKERDSLPDEGTLLAKLLNENAVRKQQNDELIAEQKHTNSLLQKMVDLQQEYMIVVRLQHESWKQKHS